MIEKGKLVRIKGTFGKKNWLGLTLEITINAINEYYLYKYLGYQQIKQTNKGGKFS